jgi:hypothetical protein
MKAFDDGLENSRGHRRGDGQVIMFIGRVARGLRGVHLLKPKESRKASL